jgi:hypothetical protein
MCLGIFLGRETSNLLLRANLATQCSAGDPTSPKIEPVPSRYPTSRFTLSISRSIGNGLRM